MTQTVSVTIPNWEKYNPRNDRTNHVWFRMQNSFFQDPKIFALNGAQQRLYLFLMCEASKQGEQTFETNLEFVSAILRLDKSEIENDFDHLSALGLINFIANQRTAKGRRKTANDGHKPSNGTATIQTDNTDRHNNTKQDTTNRVFDFDSLYKKYPRKEGKTRGLQICNRVIKTTADYDSLCLAIEKYSKKNEFTEKRFLKHFDSFMGCWKEFLDPEYDTVPDSKRDPDSGVDWEKIRAEVGE